MCGLISQKKKKDMVGVINQLLCDIWFSNKTPRGIAYNALPASDQKVAHPVEG